VKRAKYIALLLVTCFMMHEILFVEPPQTVQAANSTQQQIDQAEKEKDALENKLDKTQDELDRLKENQAGLEKELKNLKTELTEVSEHLEDLENQIAEKEQSIAEATNKLEEAIKIQEEQYESMVVRVRSMYERNDSDMVSAILDITKFFSMLNKADWYEQIDNYDKQKLEEYKQNRDYVQETKETLEYEMAVLDNLSLEAEQEKNKVAGLISQTSKTIARYEDNIEATEAKAAQYEADIRKKEEDLTYLKKKLEEEIRLSQLAAGGTWRSIGDITFADGDRYLLANLIYCEAVGEPYEGQVAVGSVVINRMLSNQFPNTLVGVVYQKGQFSPAESGRLELALATNKANESCYRAADEAMAGKTTVGNCVFFRRPVAGLTGITIGHHIFY